MKLNEDRPNVETFGELDEQFFSIADQGMIFDILRKKMYSNPILAICREISCNARDAHREVGKTDVPIHIYLPNAMEPYYKVKDFGPGISPERMANVFIKYTASTKREDNVQTGGFGLGAKTPFSYSDTFAIITRVDGIQYSYTCFIDETRVGKLQLGAQAPTDEPNGTEIKIPVKPQNYTEFATWTEQACRHWDVKPVIKGGSINWTDFKVILEGETKDWKFTHSHDYGRQAMMIIDGIEYPLPLDSLRKYADAKLIDSARGNLLMYFKVGELTLSASREQVYLDEKTQAVIRKRLSAIMAELKDKVVTKINSFSNLWDANIYYRNELRFAFHDTRFLGALNWKTCPLEEDTWVNTGCVTFIFTKGKWSRKHGNDPKRLTRSTTHELRFHENSALFLNDLPIQQPTPKHVRKAFDDDPTLKILHVVCPNDKNTQQELNTRINLDKMAPRLLSSITKASKRTYTPASSRVLVFKFDEKACAFKQSSYAVMEEDSNNKVLCFLTKDQFPATRQILLKSKNSFHLGSLREVAIKYAGNSFYGVASDTPSDRLEEDFSDCKNLDKFLEDLVKNNKIDFMAVKLAANRVGDLDASMMRVAKIIEPLISDPNSLALKRVKLHLKLAELSRVEANLLDIYQSVKGQIVKDDIIKFVKDNPEYDLDKIEDEFSEKYPLIGHINYYYDTKEVAKSMAHYINLSDK